MAFLLYENDNNVHTDSGGHVWTHFVVDEFAMQEPGICEICGEETREGWLCLDGGDEMCMECVVVE